MEINETTIRAAWLRPGDVILPHTPGWPGTVGVVRRVSEGYPNDGTGFCRIGVSFWFRKYGRSFVSSNQVRVRYPRNVR